MSGGQATAAAAAPTAAVPTYSAATAPQGSRAVPGIKYRHVGKSGLVVSNLALGSMKLFSGDPEASEAIVSAAYERGVTFFDVSDPYNFERAEVEFGKIFKKRQREWPRRSYVVCTKIYWGKHEDRSLSRKEIIETVEQSLRNLQMDYIDLVLINKYDPNCPVEEVIRAMTYLINHGKVMYWGTARWSPVELMETFSQARLWQLVAPICEMGEYHWFHREKVEIYMGELYNKIGLGLFTWSPVSYGLAIGRQEETTQLLAKLLIKNAKYRENVLQACGNSVGNPTAQAQAALAGGSITDPSGGGAAAAALSDPHGKIKRLEQLSENLKFDTISQMFMAWSMKNQSSVSCVCSAATLEQFEEILGTMPQVEKMTIHNCEDIEKILQTKPARPPMVSTLTQRWAATGGIAPC